MFENANKLIQMMLALVRGDSLGLGVFELEDVDRRTAGCWALVGGCCKRRQADADNAGLGLWGVWADAGDVSLGMECGQAVGFDVALVSGLPGDVPNVMLMMLACVCGMQRCKQSDADDVGFGPGVFEVERM